MVRGPGGGGGEVEESVVGREVVAVVEARDMVQEGVVEERLAVDGVHEDVEGGKGAEGGEEEGYTGFGEERCEIARYSTILGARGASLQCP